MTFAQSLDQHVARLGIAQTCAVLGITRRTLEQWRAGREPRLIIRRGVLAVLEETKPDKLKSK